MQLKEYQRQTLRDLELYIETLNNSKSLSVAYSQYWAGKGVSVNGFSNSYLHPYINSVNGVPRVTLKVPTAGGKTFIACNAIKRIMDKLQTGASILGVTVMGGFVPSMIGAKLSVKLGKDLVDGDGNVVQKAKTLQEALDAIFPYTLPLIITGCCYWAIKVKKLSPLKVIFALFVVAFVLGALGWMS